MRTTIRRLILLTSLAGLASCPKPAGPLLRAERVGEWTLRDGWTELRRPRGLSTLVHDRGKPGEARMHFFSIPYLSHDQALQHLSHVARGSDTPSRFETIDGWPALVRRQTQPAPEVGGEATELRPRAPRGSDLTAVTVMLAVGNRVVRAEGSTSVKTAVRVADEMEAIGRSVRVPERADPAQTERDLAELARRGTGRPPRDHKGAIGHHPPRDTGGLHHEAHRVVQLPGTFTGVEQETAASENGRVVVVGTGGPSTISSSDGGNNWFTSFTPPSSLNTLGDGSIARGGSGHFYYTFLTIPDGSAKSGVNSIAGCGIAVAKSPDGKTPFTLLQNAALFPLNGGESTPDQEHVAADPREPKAGRDDEVYVVFREIDKDPDTQCASGVTNNVSSFYGKIVCSSNGGADWGQVTDINDDDRPRVGVGGDGAVYVAVHGSDTMTICKFSSCSSGLQLQFCNDIADDEEIDCPAPGMDRCDGNGFVSPTVAGAGDGNPNHIFASWATQVDNGYVAIDVAASLDGGQSWTGPVEVSDRNEPNERYLPWMCAMHGRAFVGWHDRRFADPTHIDLDRFFRGSAALDAGGNLNADPTDIDVSGVNDPQCASAWSNGADNSNDFTTCTTPPKFFTTGPTNGGVPKYGDYNGIACAPKAPGGGHVFATWGSGTKPNGSPVSPKNGLLAILVDAIPCGGTGQFCCNGTTCNSDEDGAPLSCDLNQICRDCGKLGEPCCGAPAPSPCTQPGTVCSNHVCYCGGQGDPCDASRPCCSTSPWLQCVDGTCGCGDFGQACCGGAGGTCNLPQYVCDYSARCKYACGHDKQPCCNSPVGKSPPSYTEGATGTTPYCFGSLLTCTPNGCRIGTLPKP